MSLIGCKIAKAEMTHFQRHWLLVNTPFTKEDKILIPEKAKMSAASTSCCDHYGLLVGLPSSRQWQMTQRPH